MLADVEKMTEIVGKDLKKGNKSVSKEKTLTPKQQDAADRKIVKDIFNAARAVGVEKVGKSVEDVYKIWHKKDR